MPTDYYMLIASLPYMPKSFEVQQVPISSRRLQDRLTMLDEHDRQVVDQVQHFLQWDRQEVERNDEDVQHEYERLMKTITNRLVRDIINYRMDVRTIVCALRRRRLGLEPPTAVGQYVDHIRNNWGQSDFRLHREHPWIAGVREYLEAKDPLQVERRLLLATWSRWMKLSDKYHFSFETVLLYLARWEIVDRWTRLDSASGQRRFDTLMTKILEDHARITE